MELGPVGVWTFQLEGVPVARAQELVVELEELGYAAVWVPEAVGREALTHAALLLACSRRIVVATGIASIWWREPMAANAAQRTLAEAFPGRFLLGLGVSHGPSVEGMLGRTYQTPYSKMVSYLDAMDSALYLAVGPDERPPRVLAALGPRMLRLAAERADGAHPYFVPVEHTAFARETMGAGPLLAVEQAAVLETDPAVAREIARGHMAMYLGLANYRNNLLRLGFGEDDLADGGSDRLVDAIVAWGDPEDVAARVRAHREAGADHVCVQVLPPDQVTVPVEAWRRLAPALL